MSEGDALVLVPDTSGGALATCLGREALSAGALCGQPKRDCEE
jgi:hypothetical protein